MKIKVLTKFDHFNCLSIFFVKIKNIHTVENHVPTTGKKISSFDSNGQVLALFDSCWHFPWTSIEAFWNILAFNGTLMSEFTKNCWLTQKKGKLAKYACNIISVKNVWRRPKTLNFCLWNINFNLYTSIDLFWYRTSIDLCCKTT